MSSDFELVSTRQFLWLAVLCTLANLVVVAVLAATGQWWSLPAPMSAFASIGFSVWLMGRSSGLRQALQRWEQQQASSRWSGGDGSATEPSGQRQAVPGWRGAYRLPSDGPGDGGVRPPDPHGAGRPQEPADGRLRPESRGVPNPRPDRDRDQRAVHRSSPNQDQPPDRAEGGGEPCR